MTKTRAELDAATEAGELVMADPRPAHAVLLVSFADGSTRTLPVGKEPVSFGRDASASVCIDEPRVSRLHARVFSERDRIIIEDLGSRNGTLVDDAALQNARQELSGGQRIRIGSVEALVAMVRKLPRASAAGSSRSHHGPSVVVADPEMQRVLSIARRLAETPTTCLILGETGVGKDVVARTIHAASTRAGGPFVRFNCAATPDGLLESELFGHEKGAFTGADRTKLGFVETAAGGTLFLDEVGELPATLQAKLLSFLEHHSITRVGSTREITVDVRVLAATHRDLEADCASGHFRRDLYFRLAGFTLQVPPLRARRSEIPLLAEHFARELAEQRGRSIPNIAGSTVSALLLHDWPGNVRELRNAIEHAFVLADEHILPEHLPPGVRRAAGSGVESSPALEDRLSAVERSNIVAALEAESGNRTRAAKRLGISRRALIYKLHKHGLG